VAQMCDRWEVSAELLDSGTSGWSLSLLLGSCVSFSY
jgi:hypothetical protein